jgi:hypothetical protein
MAINCVQRANQFLPENLPVIFALLLVICILIPQKIVKTTKGTSKGATKGVKTAMEKGISIDIDVVDGFTALKQNDPLIEIRSFISAHTPTLDPVSTHENGATIDSYRSSELRLVGAQEIIVTTTPQKRKWQRKHAVENAKSKRSTNIVKSSVFRSSWVYLVALGVLASITAFLVDVAVIGIDQLRNICANLGSHWIFQLLLYVGFRMIVLLLGVSLTYFI